MYSKIFKRTILLFLAVLIFFAGACSGRNPSLGQIAWGFQGSEVDENGKVVDGYVTEWSTKHNIFYVGNDDIEELVLDAQLKTEIHGSISIEIINNSKDDEVEWADTLEGGDVKFSIRLSNLKAGDIYSIKIEANNIKTINFGITPSGSIEFVKENSSDIYRAIKQ